MDVLDAGWLVWSVVLRDLLVEHFLDKISYQVLRHYLVGVQILEWLFKPILLCDPYALRILLFLNFVDVGLVLEFCDICHFDRKLVSLSVILTKVFNLCEFECNTYLWMFVLPLNFFKRRHKLPVVISCDSIPINSQGQYVGCCDRQRVKSLNFR